MSEFWLMLYKTFQHQIHNYINKRTGRAAAGRARLALDELLLEGDADGGLPGPRGAHDGDSLTLAHGKCYVFKYGKLSATVLHLVIQPFNFKDHVAHVVFYRFKNEGIPNRCPCCSLGYLNVCQCTGLCQ